jgi:hypothetical protein
MKNRLPLQKPCAAILIATAIICLAQTAQAERLREMPNGDCVDLDSIRAQPPNYTQFISVFCAVGPSGARVRGSVDCRAVRRGDASIPIVDVSSAHAITPPPGGPVRKTYEAICNLSNQR